MIVPESRVHNPRSLLYSASGPSLFPCRVALSAALFLVFLVSPVLQISDAKYSMLMADSLVRYQSPDLSRYSIPHFHRDKKPPFDFSEGNAYQLGYLNGKTLYWFPHGSSWLSAPFVGLADLFGLSPSTRDLGFDLYGEVMIQKILAAALMAVLACVIFDTARLLLDVRWSLLIAIGSALGTQVWSTGTRGMWSHTWEILLGGLAVYVLLGAEQSKTSAKPALLATILAWMYFVRPTAAVPVAFVSIYIAMFRPGELCRFISTGLLWLAAFLLYSWSTFGSILPAYYAASRLSFGSFPVALVGNLISPTRGLFVFVPVTMFVLYLLARHWRRLAFPRLAVLALATVAGILCVVSSYWIWWGGECYGPRFMTDAIPWLALLAILACDALPRDRRSLRVNPALSAGLVLLALSVAINARGAMSWSTLTWNDTFPVAEFNHVLDWSYPQFLAGLINDPWASNAGAPRNPQR